MPNLISTLQVVFIWALFFFTTVYGHIGLKLAVQGGSTTGIADTIKVLTSFWGFTALGAWTLSALLWVFVLAEHSVIEANSISTLRYVLIALAAMVCLGEKMTGVHILGTALISSGVYLMLR